MEARLPHALRSILFSVVILALLLGFSPGAWSPATAQEAGGDRDQLTRQARNTAVQVLQVEKERVRVSDVQVDGQWATGYVVVTATETEGPDLLVFIGKHNPETGWSVSLEGQPRYTRWIALLPDSLSAPYIQTDQQAASDVMVQGLTPWVEQPELALPWGTGETWKITGGPHNNSGKNIRPWSALDFSPGTTGSWKVRSAAGGVVSISASCKNFVLIKHSNGWQTGYYHLTGISVTNGQSITKGTYLGKTSTAVGCGGSANGAHVHFTLRKSGVYQEWKNRYIGGFYVRDGSSQYSGCLERVSDKKKFCPGASFGNGGQIGLGKPGTPQLLAPVGGATVNAGNFSWISTYGVVNYRIEIASEPTFAAPLLTGKPTSASYSTNSLAKGTYYWRVRGENFSHSGDWSNVQSFTLDTSAPPPPPPPSPIIVNPVLTPGFGDICKTAWYKVTGAGYNKSNVYLTLNTNVSSQSTNSGKWTPTIPLAGRYKVEAYIGHHGVITWSCPTKTISGDTSDARYKIYYSGGSTTKVINQLPLDNQWASLGEYYFTTGTSGYVKLADLNGESNLSRTISFNVLRFTWVGP